MSTRVTDTGLRISSKGRMNRLYTKGTLSVRLSPDKEERAVMVRRMQGDRPFDLFLTVDEAETLADALDELLSYVETL